MTDTFKGGDLLALYMHTQALTVRFPWSATPDATETVEIEAPSLVALADSRRDFERGFNIGPRDRWGMWPQDRMAVLVSAGPVVSE